MTTKLLKISVSGGSLHRETFLAESLTEAVAIGFADRRAYALCVYDEYGSEVGCVRRNEPETYRLRRAVTAGIMDGVPFLSPREYSDALVPAC